MKSKEEWAAGGRGFALHSQENVESSGSVYKNAKEVRNKEQDF